MKKVIILFLLCAGLMGCSSTSKKSKSSNSNAERKVALQYKDTLRVMTYNIKHGGYPLENGKADSIDLKAIAKVINKHHPDLVALQEVDSNTTRSGIHLNEVKKLGQLTDMYSYFGRAMNYKGGKYGDAVLSRFPIQGRTTYALPIPKGSTEETRDLCVIKVELSNQRSLYFASTHLGLSKGARLLQIKKIAKIVHSISTPLILAGDFNAKVGSPAIDQMDKILTRSCPHGCAPSIPSHDPTHRIDYITYRPANWFKVMKEKVIPNGFASDHRPVMSVILYGEP